MSQRYLDISFENIVRKFRITARDFLAAKQISLRCYYQSLKYDATIDPYEIYHVDPSDIINAMEAFKVPKRAVAGTVRGGSWDKHTQPFTESEGAYHFHVYESFSKRFKKGVPWEDTKFYQTLLNEVQEGRIWWGCRSERDILERCNKIEQIYEDIKENGYKTQEEIYATNSFQTDTEILRAEVYRKINGEVAICIGRDGELIFYDGRNRLTISKILGLKVIPVVILVRHKQWQQLRDRIATGQIAIEDLDEDLRSHPDLTFLMDDSSSN